MDPSFGGGEGGGLGARVLNQVLTLVALMIVGPTQPRPLHKSEALNTPNP